LDLWRKKMSKFSLLSTFFTVLVLLFLNISAEPSPHDIDINAARGDVIVHNIKTASRPSPALRPEPQPKFLAASRPSPALRPEPQPRFLAASRPSPARRSGRRSAGRPLPELKKAAFRWIPASYSVVNHNYQMGSWGYPNYYWSYWVIGMERHLQSFQRVFMIWSQLAEVVFNKI